MARAHHLNELVNLSDSEIGYVAETVNKLVHERATESLLRGRYLLGVIKRHSGTVEQSYQSLQRARIASPQLRAFVIYNSRLTLPIGLASIQDGLELEKQAFPIPPKISRKTSLGTSVAVMGANAAAWVGARYDQYSSLTEAYFDLRMSSGGQIWTREPIRSDPDIHTAIQDAGFKAGAEGRLDDLESSWSIPPTSRYYEAYLLHRKP